MRFVQALIVASLLTGPAALAAKHKRKSKYKAAGGAKATSVVPRPTDTSPTTVDTPSTPIATPAEASPVPAPAIPPTVDAPTSTEASAPTPDATPTAAAEDAPARWHVDFGPGVDARWRRGINPEFGSFTVAGQLFTTVRYQRWGLGLEVANVPERRTQSGGLSIRTNGFVPAAWARYTVRVIDHYRFFVTLGGGRRLERVRTSFQNVVDTRNGHRDFVGLGAGVAGQIYTYFLVEAEARVTSEEAAKFPGLAVVARVGITL